ncbi:MAG: DNA polymerase III subunit gamma/tau [Bdellovibrionota bacterium]
MAYLGLARKWRPQTFDDLVGQGHIAQTLSNAIKAGRVSQGYLFTGTRGIGKTSAARIFAKALRCSQTKQPGVPCNTCNDCLEVTEGRSVDVLEIDGASNNGVDAVREIRENAKYLPSNGKHKIYIIDEVHMLTTAAFNALLKTLEEPPAHVLFIFATTDPQKIPATVLSRCQRFDFKRVSQKDLHERLKKICEVESVSITEEALNLLAREAEGSMRDAISLLDQILAIGAGRIEATTVAQALGLIDKQTILDCVTGILRRQPLSALEAVGKVYLHGFDLKQFGRELLRYLRQLMVARLLEEKTQLIDLRTYLDISDVDSADLKTLTQLRSLEELDLLFRLLNHGLEDVARSSIPKMVMDVLVIKMATGEDLISLEDLKSPDDLVRTEKQGFQPQSTPNVAAAKTPLATPSPSPLRSQAHQPRPQGESIASQAQKPQEPQQQQHTRNLPADPGNLWKDAVAFVKAQKPLVGSVLEHMGLEAITRDGNVTLIQLSYTKDHSFYKDQLLSRAYSDLLNQLLKNYLGSAVRLEYKEVLATKSLQSQEEERKKNLIEEGKKAVLQSEAMRATQQLLGAKLEKLELRGESNP